MPLSDGFVGAVSNGPLLVAIAVAALVGVVGFLSPCVLPLVPGYLSYLAGLSGSDNSPAQRRMIAGSCLFVLGFTVVFVVTSGVFFAGLGDWIVTHRTSIERVLGAVTILLGIVFLGAFGPLQREFRLHHRPPRVCWARR